MLNVEKLKYFIYLAKYSRNVVKAGENDNINYFSATASSACTGGNATHAQQQQQQQQQQPQTRRDNLQAHLLDLRAPARQYC